MLKLKIVTPERVEFDGQVERVVVPGTQGQFEILTNHAPIISTLQKGIVVYDVNELPILGGFVEVQKNEVSLCVEKAE
ncbi:MAG: ATP synthase F1 subunit epsilon [Prevotella sp.]|nr:ATP synthase F1 subunit epsilon [Prevotella sp.]